MKNWQYYNIMGTLLIVLSFVSNVLLVQILFWLGALFYYFRALRG